MSNLSSLVTSVAATTGQTKKATEETLTALFAQITFDLKSGEEVRINNFGNFKTAERAARQGRNPATGAPLTIAASTQVKFSPSSVLKSAVA